MAFRDPSRPPPSAAELRARMWAAHSTVTQVWSHCSDFGMADLDLIEIEAYLYEALACPPLVITAMAQALWEIEEFD